MALLPVLFSPPAKTELPTRPSLTLFFWLVGAFILTLLPHVEQLPIWISLAVIIAMVIRSLFEIYRLPLPSTSFTAVLALCLMAAIFLQYQTILGRDAGTAFMAGLMAIKFYELRSPRDIAMIIFSSFFVVMSALLYSQALELFIYCLIMMWLLTATLLRTNMGDLSDNSLLHMLGLSGIIFFQALPLAVFFFFVLPRYPGKLQLSLNESPLGLTNTVQPGSISRLADDDSPAMYVKFISGDVPAVDTMYWRALVLWEYKNGAWIQGQLGDIPRELPFAAPDSKPVVQEITISAHNQRWLFALDYPVLPAVNSSEAGTWSTPLYGGVIRLGYWGAKLDHKERYSVTSADRLAEQELKPAERTSATALPANDAPDRIAPEVINLADHLRKENPDDASYILAVLHYFRKNLVYSPSPGTGPADWLPDFLFVKKRGFCEHFAAAFAVLMRLEGLPARLVVGYQGAEFNPYDNLYTVKQSNAHAWNEVWLRANDQPDANKEMGRWMRVDPTAVLPLGTSSPLPSNNSNKSEDNTALQIVQRHPSLAETYLPEWARHALDDFQMRRQQVEANWDDWVFSYDPEVQYRLAKSWGLRWETMLLACGIATGICVVTFRRWMRQRVRLSPIEKHYATFCRRMAQHGIPRARWEGPLAYTERVGEAFPEKRQAIHQVGNLVAQFRYSAEPDASSTPKELESLLTEINASAPVSVAEHEKS